jgi:hypothetical protein
MKQPDIYLMLIAARELDEMIIDILLERDDIIRRFGSQIIDAHGARIGYANVAEQVRGRAQLCEFKLLMAREDLDDILAALRERLPRAEITYWAFPLLAYGRVN